MKRSASAFIDRVRLSVHAGKGAAGNPKLKGKGGDGGSIFLEAFKGQTMNTLVDQFPLKKIKAGHGEESIRRNLIGSRGSDFTVRVPPGVTASLDNGKVLGDLDTVGDRLLVARGGKGGGPKNGFTSEFGQRHMLRIDLKLIADIGLVGFPNAGKSSLMSTLSRAQPNIAAYPFTTIRPQLATLCYEDHRQITMADLPGLIEGAHINVGLGHKFLKHVERTKCLLFVVDVMGFRLNLQAPFRTPIETILLLNRELELYKSSLLNKPALCVLNKIDLPGGVEAAERVLQQLADLKVADCPKDVVPSITADEMPHRLINFQDVFAISAKSKENIPELKLNLREYLDKFLINSRTEDAKDCAALSTNNYLDDAFKETIPSRV